MDSDGDLLIVNHRLVEIGDGVGGTLLLEELDVAKAFTFAIGIDIKFAGSDLSVFLEGLHQLLLVNVLWQISNNDVSLLVKILLLLLVEHDLLPINGLVVHVLHAPLGLIFLAEVQVSKPE